MSQRPIRIVESFPLLQDPPFSLDGTRAQMLVLPADRTALEAICTRTFGWAAPEVVIQPAAGIVLLVITDVAAARAKDPLLGSFSYREVSFFVPVVGTRNGVPFFGMHVPFIYPNEGLAVAAGREIYGLPKKPASIAFPDETAFGQGAPIEARALCAAVFDGSQWQERQLLRITTEPQGFLPELEDTVLDAIDAFVGPIHLPSRLIQQDLFQLKQPADVTTGGTPPHVLCRQLVRVAAPLKTLSNVRIADPSKFRVEIEDWASEPIRSTLGLAPVVVPALAMSVTMDFRFEPGEVWVERPVTLSAPSPKKRVLVLGGGVSGLTAAHALTDTLSRRDNYEVRLLSEGHVLGGKGANVRDPSKNERIEEHGLHVIFGFYHNFLRLFRSVYAEAGRPLGTSPRTFHEAFRPHHHLVFADGKDSWELRFPETPDTYGAGPNTLEEQLQGVRALIEAIAGTAFSLLGTVLPGMGMNPVQKEVIKFVATLVAGITADIVVQGKSWDELDDEDFRAWMMRHTPPFGFGDIEWSAIMQVPYDGIFAYEGGNQDRPRLAAGTAARNLLDLVTDYEKAPYHVMTAGMGETVVMPLYEVLRNRGVGIEMFSRVKEIRMVGGRVNEVVIARQARVLAGDGAYDPVVNVKGVPCWRRDPDPAQLDPASPALNEDPFFDSSTAQIGPDLVLKDGVDFDWVICALPAPVTASVLRNHMGNPLLEDIGRIPTVATLHTQLWLNKPLPMLGWNYQSLVAGGFRQPLNSMLDSEHILRREAWPANGPRGLLYLSGPFGGGWSTDSTDPAARASAAQAAKDEARAFTKNELQKILPAADTGGQFDFSELHAPYTPASPFDDQYVRGNIDKSSRYTLLLPGTLGYRPRPDDASLENLRFVGDWTKNGIDIPCMEGTVTSALLAVQSITGEPLDILD